MNVLLLFLVVFCFLQSQAQGHEVLSEKSSASEKDCLDLLSSDTFDASTLSAKHVGYAMKRGFWKCAKELSNMANFLRIDVRSVFDMESRSIAKEIKDIKATIESTLPVSVISPAFQWAQSTTEIFISVKFAHKLDAPATLNVEAETVNITEDNLTLKATDGRKVFNLNVDFLRKVVPSESSWSMASVGRMTVTLKKKTGPDNWVRLTKSKKKPNNIHFWWELHEKHSRELEALEDEDDEGGAVVKPPAKEKEEGKQDAPGGGDARANESAEEKSPEDASSSQSSPSSPEFEHSEAKSDESPEGESESEGVAKPKKDKKKRVKKGGRKDKKKDKTPSLDELVKELEKAGKEKKKEVDRQARLDREAINQDTEEKVKQLRRDFYKSDKDKAKEEENKATFDDENSAAVTDSSEPEL